MKRHHFFVLSSSILILFFACFERQSHEVTAPEIPHYDVTGVVRDIDSGEILANCIISLEAVSLAFPEVEFTAISDTSDSTGAYQFKAITPGQYNISLLRDGYRVMNERLLLEYVSKTFDLNAPKPLVTHDFYPSSYYGKCWGMHWVYINKMARIVLWRFSKEGDNRTTGIRIDEGNFDDGFTVQGRKSLKPENPALKGLAFLSNYWAGDKSGSSIYFVNQGNSKVAGQYEVPYQIEDLTASQTNLWASTLSGHILKFTDKPAQLEQDFHLPDEKFAGIAWDQKSIWVGEVNRNLIIQRDNEMKPQQTFRAIYLDLQQNQHEVTPLQYLAFDFYRKLWIANDSGYYRFEIPPSD